MHFKHKKNVNLDQKSISKHVIARNKTNIKIKEQKIKEKKKKGLKLIPQRKALQA